MHASAPRLIEQMAAHDNLLQAWRQVRANKGEAGTDGVSLAEFEKRLEANLTKLTEQLLTNRYQPQPLLWFKVPKANGGVRILAVPTVRDRVVHRVFVNILQPLCEPLFLDCSFGFRPRRGTKDAAQQVLAYRQQGYHWIVDADIKSCFDTIEHQLLLKFLAQSLSDPAVVRVIDLWLRQMAKVPFICGGGRLQTPRGLPQGSPLSPLLCNIYLHQFDRDMLQQGLRLVRYADDFVILCRTRREAEHALKAAQVSLAKLYLDLHPDKTRIISTHAPFVFVGYRFDRRGASLLHPPASDGHEEGVLGWLVKAFKFLVGIS